MAVHRHYFTVIISANPNMYIKFNGDNSSKCVPIHETYREPTYQRRYVCVGGNLCIKKTRGVLVNMCVFLFYEEDVPSCPVARSGCMWQCMAYVFKLSAV